MPIEEPGGRLSEGEAGAGRARTGPANDDTMATNGKKTSFWRLLKNPQMAVLCAARLGDPMAVTSILSYLFFQLRYLSPDAPDATLATQAGLLVGANTIAKVTTGILWGRLADSVGRKPVLIVGLFSSALACAAYGFSTTFPMALIWQAVQGAMSANISMTRTVVAELYANSDINVRSRALLLLVLFNGFGMLFGPLVGGFATHQQGMGSIFSEHPFALPNLLIAGIYGVAGLGVLLVVAESLPRRAESSFLESKQNSLSPSIWQLARKFLGLDNGKHPSYRAVTGDDEDSVPLTSISGTPGSPDELDREDRHGRSLQVHREQSISMRQICTPRFVATMAAHFIITGHISTFATVWTIFLSTPIQEPESDISRNSARFILPTGAGGIGLQPPQIGTFMTCATALAVVLQMSLLPRLTERLGTIRVWRSALWLFPLVYFLAPLPAAVTSVSDGDDDASGAASPGIIAWVAISLLMVLFMIARTGAQPPMVILINECVEHAHTRGTVNAVGTTVGNLARTVFPVTIMAVYGLGLRVGFVALAFWVLSAVALAAVAAGHWAAKSLDEHAVLKKPREAEA